IKLFKKDSTEVKLQSFGSKHYDIADVNKYRIKVVEDVSDVLKKNPNELVKFEFDIYGVNLHQDLSKLDNEDKNNTLELKLYREPNKRVYDAGEKLNLEGIYVKRTAVDDSFTKDIYSSNYDTYLKLTRKDTNEEVAHDTVFTNDDKGKEVTFVLTTKDKAAKSVEFTVTVNGDKEVKFIKVFDATTNEELAKVEVTLDKDNLKFNAATDLKLPSKYKGKKNDIKVKSYCNETEEFGEVTVKALRVAFYQFVVKLPGLDDGYICSGRPVWE
ncbi:MAG: hypothetical protein ACTTH0_04315, partial [Eubacteriales bacterium]